MLKEESWKVIDWNQLDKEEYLSATGITYNRYRKYYFLRVNYH